MNFLPAKKLSLLIILVVTTGLFSSCGNLRKAIYFNDIGDAQFKTIGENVQPVIQENDLLSIYVTSLNSDATAIFNSQNPFSGNSASGQNGSGYLVNQDGNIQYPLLGLIAAGGLTKKQLGDKLVMELTNKKLLIDPIITVRFLNFKVTVLGEVAHPTVVPVPNEKITILEALGFAGDLTIYANRENVLLMRDENGIRTIKRINLNSSTILKSPYFYLKSNDVVYVEPNRAKVTSSSTSTLLLPVILSGLSFLAIIFDRYVR